VWNCKKFTDIDTFIINDLLKSLVVVLHPEIVKIFLPNQFHLWKNPRELLNDHFEVLVVFEKLKTTGFFHRG
jgi:hypothetical protein